jgi:hypothetical protein
MRVPCQLGPARFRGKYRSARGATVTPMPYRLAHFASEANVDGGNGCQGWTDIGLPPGISQLNGVASYLEAVVAVGSSVVDGGSVSAVGIYNGVWDVTMPAGGVLRAVWSDGAHGYIAVGDAGTVLLGSDTGGGFNPVYYTSGPKPTANLTSVWGQDMNHFWVGGAGGAAWLYDGSTGTWAEHSIPSVTQTVAGIWGTSLADFWVTVQMGYCSSTPEQHYTGTWTAASSTNGCYSWNAIWGSSANDIWTVGYSKGTWSHYTGTWSTATTYGLGVPMNMNGISGRDASNIWAVGDTGAVAAYDGNAWTMCTSPTVTALSAVTVTPTKVWAVGGTVLVKN